MNIYKSSLFKYIAGDSLVGKSVSLTIARVALEEVEGQNGRKEEKLILYFRESEKGMILNKTNAKRIAKLFGGETDNWTGKAIELYAEEVKAFGEIHNAIRVRESKAQKAADKVKADSRAMSNQQHKERLASNPLRPADEDNAIGEDAPPQEWKQFVSRVCREIPFFMSEKQVKQGLNGLVYTSETEAACFDALAQYAGQEADKEAAF